MVYSSDKEVSNRCRRLRYTITCEIPRLAYRIYHRWVQLGLAQVAFVTELPRRVEKMLPIIRRPVQQSAPIPPLCLVTPTFYLIFPFPYLASFLLFLFHLLTFFFFLNNHLFSSPSCSSSSPIPLEISLFSLDYYLLSSFSYSTRLFFFFFLNNHILLFSSSYSSSPPSIPPVISFFS